MSRNALFLISFGCLLILLSCMVPAPLGLIALGLLLAVWGAVLLDRERRKAPKGEFHERKKDA